MKPTSFSSLAAAPSFKSLVSAAPAKATGRAEAVSIDVSETWKRPVAGGSRLHWKGILLSGLLWATTPGSLRAQMNMGPYFTTINYPLEKNSLMLMALPDLQVARSGGNFATGMLMSQYGITARWTAGVMVEGQKISGMPVTYGGMRLNTYLHPFRDDRLLNLTLYVEYEDLNGAALYKMEVAGFGPGDLTEPLALARRTPARTLEQRVILYHDWDRLNVTFNFVRETAFQTPHASDYGYALGAFVKPSWMSGSALTGTPSSTTSAPSSRMLFLAAGRCGSSLLSDFRTPATPSSCAREWPS